MDRLVVRKDAPPAETIARIHGILDTLGFDRGRALVTRWSAGTDCHSCHLRFGNYPLIFANGKGVTPELATASALAEFIERLQCRADALFTTAGRIHHLEPFAPWTAIRWSEAASAHPRLFAADLAGPPVEAGRPLACLPFVDLFGGRIVDLPFDLLTTMTGSSGMCAGNTPEEALAHGIGEVFERHVIHAIESGRVQGLPTLPLETLPIRSGVLRRQIDALAASGVEARVKDATLGGVYPVLAVVLSDREARTCHVAFGSDPVFDAALSRCLTEAFQGATRLFRRVPRAERPGRPLDVFNNLESLADRLAASVGPPASAAAFSDAATSDEALAFVLDRVRCVDRRLYIRDCSLFGFPAYYVYVEELSALEPLAPEHFAHLRAGGEAVRATLFGLPHASAQEVARCADLLFNEITRCDPTLESHFAADVLRAPAAGCLGLRPLLVLMLLEAGALEKARVIRDWPPLSGASLGEPDAAAGVATWLESYIDARGGGIDASRMRSSAHAALGSWRPVAPASGGDGAVPLPVPRCQSVYACPSCPCRRACRLDEWHRLARRLRERAAPCGQGDLLRRLGGERAARPARSYRIRTEAE